MSAWRLSIKQLRGTVLLIPPLILLVILFPLTLPGGLALALLAGGLLLQSLPLLALPEAGRSMRLAARGQWAQARFYNVLAQDKLRRQPWRGGLRVFRTRHEPASLALTLRADTGRLWLGLGQPRDAERALRTALRDLPNHGPCWHNLALALYAQGRLRQARTALERAVELGFVQPAPELLWKGALRWLPAGARPRLRNLAFRVGFYQSLGFHDLTLACLSFQDTPEACWPRVTSLLALGRTEQARRLALEAVGRDPGHSQGWLALGFLAAQEGAFREAVRLYRKALRCDPDNAPCWEELHLLLARTRGPRGLLDALAVLDEYEPGRQNAARALLLSGLGRWEDSLGRLLAQSSGPARTPAQWELAGHCRLRLGQVRSGLRFLRRFALAAEVSGLPMLQREERLREARRALAEHDPRPKLDSRRCAP